MVWGMRFCAVALVLGLAGNAFGQGLEQRVKAAYLVNFTRFISWPPAATQGGEEAIDICVVGDRDIAIALSALIKSKPSNDVGIRSRLILLPEESEGCEVLYIADDSGELQRYWLQKLPQDNILTIADNGDFIDTGGMISFVIVSGKLRFDINQANILRSGMSVSSRLLSLARTVRRSAAKSSS